MVWYYTPRQGWPAEHRRVQGGPGAIRQPHEAHRGHRYNTIVRVRVRVRIRDRVRARQKMTWSAKSDVIAVSRVISIAPRCAAGTPRVAQDARLVMAWGGLTLDFERLRKLAEICKTLVVGTCVKVSGHLRKRCIFLTVSQYLHESWKQMLFDIHLYMDPGKATAKFCTKKLPSGGLTQPVSCLWGVKVFSS